MMIGGSMSSSDSGGKSGSGNMDWFHNIVCFCWYCDAKLLGEVPTRSVGPQNTFFLRHLFLLSTHFLHLLTLHHIGDMTNWYILSSYEHENDYLPDCPVSDEWIYSALLVHLTVLQLAHAPSFIKAQKVAYLCINMSLPIFIMLAVIHIKSIFLYVVPTCHAPTHMNVGAVVLLTW